MTMLRIGMVALLTLSLGTPAIAGELRESVAAAATAAAEEAAPPARSSSKAFVLGGSAIFAGGMVVGLYEFINNKNGSYSEFGEAAATNKKIGAAGISMAFAGGLMMLAGRHAAQMPSLTFGAKGVGVSKHVSW